MSSSTAFTNNSPLMSGGDTNLKSSSVRADSSFSICSPSSGTRLTLQSTKLKLKSPILRNRGGVPNVSRAELRMYIRNSCVDHQGAIEKSDRTPLLLVSLLEILRPNTRPDLLHADYDYFSDQTQPRRSRTQRVAKAFHLVPRVVI